MGIAPTEKDVGRRVVYQQYVGAERTEGRISAVYNGQVYVKIVDDPRFGARVLTFAPEELQWASE